MTLTQPDLTEIENIVEEKIGEKTKNLPTKHQFFKWMTKITKELQNNREQMEILNKLGIQNL